MVGALLLFERKTSATFLNDLLAPPAYQFILNLSWELSFSDDLSEGAEDTDSFGGFNVVKDLIMVDLDA